MLYGADPRKYPAKHGQKAPPPYGFYAAVAEDFYLALEFTSGQIVF